MLREYLLIAAQILLDKGVRDLIVTLGEKGCIHFNRNGSRRYDGMQVAAADTTAAGDSFVSTLAAMLNEGKGINEAVAYALAASALTVTKEGAQSSLPNCVEVENFLVR